MSVDDMQHSEICLPHEFLQLKSQDFFQICDFVNCLYLYLQVKILKMEYNNGQKQPMSAHEIRRAYMFSRLVISLIASIYICR